MKWWFMKMILIGHSARGLSLHTLFIKATTVGIYNIGVSAYLGT